MIFEYKTDPFSHQRALIEEHAGDRAYALWWEMGTGKSKGLIDNATWLYCEKEIDALFMLAPNGLHRNFVTKEIPKHMGIESAVADYWTTGQSDRKHEEQMQRLLRAPFPVFTMSYDAIMTESGRDAAKTFLTERKCLYALDESPRIKEPDAKRTKRVLASAPFAPYKRIMTGTPVSNAPWDVWTQIKFLDGDFWKGHNLDSIQAMKTAFGEWQRGVKRVPIGMAMGKSGRLKPGFVIRDGVALQQFPMLARDAGGRPQYKNLDRLREIITPIRSRVLKADVLDLPPKIPSVLDFDMSPKQRAAYNSMRELGIAVIENEQCTAQLALTVLLRLQQITCGYIVTDLSPDAERRSIPIDPNPRLDLLTEKVEDISHPFLIWARFRHDVDAIVDRLTKRGKAVARYDGAISDEECGENEEAFHRGDVQGLILTQGKGGEGLTLIEAQTAIFYSNTFRLTDRLQASDRPHRYGQTHPVNEIDIVARNSVDEKVLANLASKIDVASTVTGDSLRNWLARA